jgi:teichuronic acid biosynthesis glycosyltransferase TuaC
MLPSRLSSFSRAEQDRGNFRLHVLTLTPFYPTELDEAAGCFVAEPLAALASIGVSNSVFAVSPVYRRITPAHPSAPTSRSIRYFSLPGKWGLSSGGALLFPTLLRHVRELHRRQPIHVIHAHAALPCGHAAMLLSREIEVPFVVSVHGLDAFSVRQVVGRGGDRCQQISLLVYQSARRVICVSRHVQEQVLRGSPRSETAVVYNGADPVLFSPPGSSSKGVPRIVSIGDMIPTKGHAPLLGAIARVARNYPFLECDFVGEGPEQSRLKSLSKELRLNTRVRFYGRMGRKDIADLLRSASVFALPSTYEGLGCVYLEAMACGKVTIACRGQGIEEVIHHGIDGWLVGPDNLEELTQGIAILLQDAQLRERIGSQARATILRGFTLEHQARHLLGIYQECAL